jgi:hypothetical protein
VVVLVLLLVVEMDLLVAVEQPRVEPLVVAMEARVAGLLAVMTVVAVAELVDMLVTVVLVI